MSIGYTWEKLYGAVLALACSDGTLQDRLASAYRAMHMLTLADFPDDELREAYARFVQALRPGNQRVWREPLPHLPPSCVRTRRAPSLKSSCSCIRTLRGSRNNTTAPYLHVMCSATHALKERKSTPR